MSVAFADPKSQSTALAYADRMHAPGGLWWPEKCRIGVRLGFFFVTIAATVGRWEEVVVARKDSIHTSPICRARAALISSVHIGFLTANLDLPRPLEKGGEDGNGTPRARRLRRLDLCRELLHIGRWREDRHGGGRRRERCGANGRRWQGVTMEGGGDE
ncbi:hypothetical protein E2562_029915 [Oryza meyeriana var. granulata]|uniref:Uncharacterized protein n=1 Tax=Oryza meyeriana var. granulata TaxID=110450 RepID=A0A6G1CUI6_9ORYZ|nr:hypothetical protein E2562_029915 [Oryza meyeriana var. granulata]